MLIVIRCNDNVLRWFRLKDPSSTSEMWRSLKTLLDFYGINAIMRKIIFPQDVPSADEIIIILKEDVE